MAKIKHNNFVDTVNNIVSQARDKQIIHLENRSREWKGTTMDIGNKNLINFGTCGYLGLETNPRLVKSACDYTMRYGTQFSISRAYVTSDFNLELEEKLSQIFDGHKTLVFSSTSLAHTSVIPLVMDQKDAIILDQQAHVSMQTSCQLMAAKGTTIDVIRHNNMEMLERKIKSYRDTHDKIWYVIDGVYSMYGDIAPLEELNALAAKYPQLHFYVDDAHGMSWTGKNGCGSVFEAFKSNAKTILLTTMAKGFGSVGGIVVFPDHETFERVNIHGGPLAYSHPVAPSVVGASIAAADIHLSDDIYELQARLQEKISYCNELLSKTDLPVMSSPNTPIFFIGTGQPKVGYNLNKRMLNAGFYVNIGMFPAVSVKNTGLRFTITNHVSNHEILEFVTVLEREYSLALKDEGTELSNVYKAFKIPFKTKVEKEFTSEQFDVQQYTSIEQVDATLWNELFGERGNFDHEGLKSLEDGFTQNELPEHNWKFLYLIVKDKGSGEVVLASFFTECLMKDDMLSTDKVSQQIEAQRVKDKYYLTSNSLIMGSLITEGDHLFLDRQKEGWKDALRMMCAVVNQEKTKRKVNNIVLRDFDPTDKEVSEIFNEEGFFNMDMPNTNIVRGISQYTEESYFASLSRNSRKHIKRDVLRYEHLFKYRITNNLENTEVDLLYRLYKNVAAKNFALNIYKYPVEAFHAFNRSPNWEFFILEEKDTSEILAITCCYKTSTKYFPVVVGINYETSLKVYKQLLYQITISSIARGFDEICYGFTADIEKRKLNAVQESKIAFLSVDDLFNLEKIDKITGE